MKVFSGYPHLWVTAGPAIGCRLSAVSYRDRRFLNVGLGCNQAVSLCDIGLAWRLL